MNGGAQGTRHTSIITVMLWNLENVVQTQTLFLQRGRYVEGTYGNGEEENTTHRDNDSTVCSTR